MVAPACMAKRKTCSHVRAKYRGREKCENKNGKICFYFFKLKRSNHCNQENFTAVSDKSVVLNFEEPFYRPLIWQFWNWVN